MRTTLQMVDVVFALVTGIVTGRITGGVYEDERPNGSTNEDVVINALPVTGDMVQVGYVNVNVYVPDLEINVSGDSQNKPNHDRLSELATLIITDLAEHHLTDGKIEMVLQGVVKEPNTNQHFINIRYKFTSYQLN